MLNGFRARSDWEHLDPGWLQLKSGLAQVVFYSGAGGDRGPAELQIISPSDACRMGKLTAEIPPQARLPDCDSAMNVTDLGTVFGLDVRKPRRSYTSSRAAWNSCRQSSQGIAPAQAVGGGEFAPSTPYHCQ
jgi:hypothetical protein